MKNILLISYYFPPYKGIGGRRWAKFAKYLAKDGYRVHVISARSPFGEVSLWQQDVADNPNIIIHALPHRYPTVLESEPISIIAKIKYRSALGFVSFFAEGTPYDRSIFWNKGMLKAAQSILDSNDINTIIVSCAPFRTAYETLALKRRHPKIKLIIDFRDPWTWGELFGYKQLRSNYFLKELKMERAVLEQSDVVTFPVSVMENYLIKEYPQCKDKLNLLPHAFDENETVKKKEYQSGRFRLAFYGTLYVNIEEYIKELVSLIIKKNGLVTLDIYTEYKKYEVLWQPAIEKGFVTFNLPILGKALFERLSAYDFILFVHPNHGKDNLSTKFYEIINCRIPIIYIGEEGYTSRFLVQNELGRHFSKESLQTEGYSFFSKDTVFNYNDAFDVAPYSFRKVTESLEKIIN